MEAKNIIFYSNFCEASKYLIMLMKGERLLELFHPFCVDDNPKTPKGITDTPTLIIAGIPNPYVSTDAFAWFSKIKQWRIGQSFLSMANEQQKYLVNMNKNLQGGETSRVLGFNDIEMKGMSDIFAFFATNMADERTEALPQSFVDCENMQEQRIFVAPEILDPKKRKIKAKDQAKMLEHLEADRKGQDKEFEENIKKFKELCSNKN